MALVVTPGAANANSYATVAEANAYNSSRPFSTAWAGTDAVKEAALIQATRLLDASFNWTGAAVDATQTLSWPRSGMLTRNGFAIADTDIPQTLKDAQSEFARQLLVADRAADNEAEKQGLSSIKAGPVALGYKNSSSSSNTIQLRDADVLRMGPDFDYLSRVLPDAVRMLIPPSWYTRATISRPMMVEVQR